jgi:hypothetical protein
MSNNQTINVVEKQCADYELACRHGNLDGLRDFLAGVDEKVQMELAYELCRISIYYRCQRSRLEAGATIGPLLELCPEIRNPAMILGIVRTEFQCRADSESSANVDEYLLQFPKLSRELRRSLADEILNRYPIRVRIKEDDFTIFSMFLRQELQLGRQDKNEDEPPAISRVDECTERLIVASRYESRVSRRHATVAAHAPNIVKVTAISEKSATFIDKDRLQSGETRICPVPFVLHIGPQAVVVEPVQSN